ncbi:radical SAM protein [Candidatus Saccharibacteria bacterium]|nr:radical SAM protein [Candidatus Saccharibacteria bacterium]
MTQREQYLYNASIWTHHHPYIDKPRPAVTSPFSGYEVFPGWQILIMITSECNTRCRHCYLPYEGSFDPDELQNMIAQFQKDGYSVYLNGSEPLLNPEYLPAFQLADQKIVMTNGLVLVQRPEYIREIREAGIGTIGVSYHFDIQTYFSRVSLDVAKRALNIVKDAGIHARVMTTITKPYVDMIPKYCDWCIENGFEEIRFTNFIAQGRAQELDSDLILDLEDRKHYYELITALRAKYSIDELCITSCGSFGDCGSPNMSCMALNDFVILTPDYKVYPCFFQTQPGMECGIYHEGHIYTKTGFKFPRHDCTSLHLFNE